MIQRYVRSHTVVVLLGRGTIFTLNKTDAYLIFRPSRDSYTCTCHKPRVYQNVENVQVQITTCVHLVSLFGLE